MRSIKLTKDGDIDISTGRVQEVSDSDLTLQRIRCAFNISLGEWYLNREIGVPYHEIFFGKNTQKDKVQDAVVATLFEIPAILDILDIQIEDTRDTRIIKIKVLDKTGKELSTDINVSI